MMSSSSTFTGLITSWNADFITTSPRQLLLATFLLYHFLEFSLDFIRPWQLQRRHLVRRTISIIIYYIYINVPITLISSLQLHLLDFLNSLRKLPLHDLEKYTIVSIGGLCLLAAALSWCVNKLHAESACASEAATPSGSLDLPYRTDDTRTHTTSHDSVPTPDTHYNWCAGWVRTNGGPGWDLLGWFLWYMITFITLPLTLIKRFAQQLTKKKTKLPLKKIVNIDWNHVLSAQTDKEIRSSLFSIMKNVDRIRSQLQDSSKQHIQATYVTLIDPYASLNQPREETRELTLDAHSLATIKEQVRDIQLMQNDYQLIHPIKDTVYTTTDRLSTVRNLQENEAPYQELIAARRALDEIIKEKRENRRKWIVSDEDLPTLTSYKAVDQYLQQARYDTKYWKDPTTDAPINSESIKGKTKAELRKMLNDRQQKWWDQEQYKRGVKLYKCPDCQLTVKPGHSCLTSTSDKITYKKGIPTREVTRVIGQGGRIKEESERIVDMDHLVDIIQKALNQATKTQQVLPPIVNSLGQLLTQQTLPQTPLNTPSLTFNGPATLATPAPVATQTVSPYLNQPNPLLMDDPIMTTDIPYYDLTSTNPAELVVDLEEDIDNPNLPMTEHLEDDTTLAVKEEGEVSEDSNPLHPRESTYPLKTVHIDGKNRLVLVLPDHLHSKKNEKKDFR